MGKSARSRRSSRARIPDWDSDTPALYELPFLGYPLADLVDEVLTERFPNLSPVPSVYFGSMKRIAYCQTCSSRPPLIMMNSVLNHITVPREIIRSILIHEFLHIQIRPREIDGKWVSHPPEYIQREDELNPQKRRLWDWLNFSFLGDLIIDVPREATWLHARALKKYEPYTSVETAVEFWGDATDADLTAQNAELAGL